MGGTKPTTTTAAAFALYRLRVPESECIHIQCVRARARECVRARARIACLEYEVGYEHVAADEALEDGVARLVPAQHLQPASSSDAQAPSCTSCSHLLHFLQASPALLAVTLMTYPYVDANTLMTYPYVDARRA